MKNSVCAYWEYFGIECKYIETQTSSPIQVSISIIVDEELNWNAQVDNVCNRVSRMISFMGRLRNIINEQNMNLIYKSFV